MQPSIGSGSLLGTAWVAVRGDLNGLKDDLGESVKVLKHQFSLANLGSGVIGIGTAAAAALAPIALLEQGMAHWNHNAQEARHEASALMGAIKQLEVTLDTSGNTTGFSAAELRDYADAIQRATGVGSTGIMLFQSRLAQFQRVHGEAFQRATKVAVDWAELTGTSLPDKARILGMSLNDPIRGITMLRRAQVQLSEEEQKQVKNFIKMNEGVKAQDVLLKALEARYGGAAERMASPVKKLKSELSGALEELGKIYQKDEPLRIKVRIIGVNFQTGVLEEFSHQIRSAGFKNGSNLSGQRFARQLGGSAASAATGAGAGAAIGGIPTLGIGAGPGALIGALVFSLGYALRQVDFGPVFGQPGLDAKSAQFEKKRLELLRKTGQDLFRHPGGQGFDDADKKTRTEGFMDPITLSKRLQESMLGGDKMLGLMETSNQILERIATGVEDSSMATESQF